MTSTTFMAYLTNPNVVYLLILIAIYGLFFEITNPGSFLPGIIGIISLLFTLYAFQYMPVNYTGLMLLLIGMTFMIFEAYIFSFGIAGVIGIVAFITGSILLFDGANHRLSWPLIAIMSLISITFIFMVLSIAIQSHKRKIVSGKEGLIGSEGIVLSIMNEQIVVRVLGEIWEAKSSEPLTIGEKIKVTHVKGLVLHVEPIHHKTGA